MSEQLLEAIIQLFAFIARIDGVTENERSKIKNMLHSRLNREVIGKYMALFDFFCGLQLRVGETEITRIADLSTRIKGQITQQQKIVLLCELTQLIYSNNILSEQEEVALRIISNELKIDEEEVRAIQQFVASESIDRFNSVNILIISSSTDHVPDKCPHIYTEGHIDGYIAVLNLKSVKYFFLRYLGKSSIFLNQRPLERGKVEIVPAGSTLRSNRFKAIYYSDILRYFRVETDETAVSFNCESVYYKFGKGELGLRDINMSERNGSLIGIMGASGSGKTTLFNVLNGNEPPTQGKVTINGFNIHRQRKKIQGVIGYVPQDDLLIEELTVFQNLYYAAKLCFGHYSDTEIDDLVDKTLINLGLHDIKHQQVGDPLKKIVSGGQRKRLNIGLELLREPMVLFVDEPTSGLSSRDSENIMDLLKELSLRGKLVFTVIHQPSSDIFKMFDKLLIMDIGGYPIYYGNPVASIPYFREAAKLIEKQSGACIECGNLNAEQIFNIIETRVVDEYGRQTEQRMITPRTWYEIYKSSREPAAESEPSGLPRASLSFPGRLKQLAIFCARDVRAKLANSQYMLINLLEAPLLAFILALMVRFYATDRFHRAEYIFRENMNIPAYIFIAVIVALFMGLTVSAEEIIKDRKILKRESFLHLSRLSYLASKILILFGLSAIQTLAFVILGNLILGIHGMYLPYFLVLFSTSCFANVLGLNISSAFNSAITIYILIPILLIPQILLSGVVVKFDQLNPLFGSKARVPLIGDLMTSRWAYEAIMVHQFKHNKFEKQFYEIDKKISLTDYHTVYYIPRLESMLEFSYSNLSDSNKVIFETADYYLLTLRNEMGYQMGLYDKEDLQLIESMTRDDLDEKTYTEAKDFLFALRRLHVARQADGRNTKDQMIRQLTSSPKKAQNYQTLQNKFTNDKLTSLVYDNMDKTRILEHKGWLMQKIYPIYSEPSPEHVLDFRTIFYAPQKFFLGHYIETLYFNIAMIWFMTTVLIITLYYDLLRKLVNMSPRFPTKLE